MHQRVGIFGGTFNPIHYGHLAAAEEMRERMNLSEVLFVPSLIPPHKQEKKIPPAFHRMEMVRAAIAGNSAFFLSDVEVARGGTSYTIDTLRSLKSCRPGIDLYFITGVDSFLDIRTWHQWNELLGLCTFVVLSRPGYSFQALAAMDFIGAVGSDLVKLDQGDSDDVGIRREGVNLHLARIPLLEISSTDIRNRIVAGRSIKYLLPEQVERYIITHDLYA